MTQLGSRQLHRGISRSFAEVFRPSFATRFPLVATLFCAALGPALLDTSRALASPGPTAGPSLPSAPSPLSSSAPSHPSVPALLPSPSPAPIEASLIIAPPDRLTAIAARLTGHRFRLGDHVLLLEDIASLGRPWVGIVRSRCGALFLDTAVASFRLAGPLARPRLAGPGYLLWLVGTRDPLTSTLTIHRLGILARPDEVPASFFTAAPAPCGSASAAGA